MTAPAEGPALVAIDGVDGSGKSRLAERLLAALADDGVGATLLHVDDVRRPVDWTRTDRPELELYYDDYYDLGALDDRLRALLAGDRGGGAPAVAVVLVEGVFVRRLPVLAAAGAAVIDVLTSRTEARRRILARDVAKGRTPDDVRHRIDARYFPAQDRYRAALGDAAERADVVLDNEDLTAPRLVRLDEARVPGAVARALRRLFAAPP